MNLGNKMKPVKITGEVTKFRGNGRQLGYPTANINTVTDLAEGIYFGFADLAGFISQPALVFVGVPTTIGDHEQRVEIHVLDIPDVDYYGKTVSVILEHFHRSNQRFDGVKELLSAIRNDEKQAREWFAKNASVITDEDSDT